MRERLNPALSQLVDVSRALGQRGWLRATSGNLSIRDAETGLIYISKSGVDKGHLTVSDLIGISPKGVLLQGEGNPSFETAIHTAIYQQLPDVQAVLHVHTVFNNLVTEWAGPGGLAIQEHEMLKALGHWSSDSAIKVPVLPNLADIERLAQLVIGALDPAVPGVLIQRHGVYAFGPTLEAAVRHVEAFEFLFEWLCWQRLTHTIAGLTVAEPHPLS